MSENLKIKLHYNTVLCQTFSPDGNFLVAGNFYGDVSVYDLSLALGPRQSDANIVGGANNGANNNFEDESVGPNYQFKAHPDQQVQSMLSTAGFLVTGAHGEITGWDWQAVTSAKAAKIKPAWNIQIPYNKDSLEKPKVNCMLYSKENHHIYAGCGDNKIYVFNLDNGQAVDVYDGHTDFVHSISLAGKQLASGSEDGTVRLWDVASKENTNVLQPHLQNKVARPKLGKWIGAVDFTEDWLVCGGGPKLSLWHMRSMESATIFDLPDEGIHVVDIYEERVIVGGAMPELYHLTFQGLPLAKIPISSSTAYSLVYQEQPVKLLSVAGSSNRIDVCTNFNYREMVFKFA